MSRTNRTLSGEAARAADRVRALLGGGESESPDGTAASDGARSRLRLDPGRRPVLVLGSVVAIVAVLTGLWVLSSRPESMPVPAVAPGAERASPLVPASPTGSPPPARGTPSAAPTRTGSGVVVVDVAGRVARPGVYRLPAGSRVDDALRAAGGARPGVDLASLNLASVLVDGQQIAVGRPGAVMGPALPLPSAGGTGVATAGGPAGVLDLNAATLGQLEDLPGIGPALGQRILDYRTEHGSFTAADQLDDVPGIGTVIFERLKPLVRV